MRAATSFITLAAMSLGMATALPSKRTDDHDGPIVDADIEQVGKTKIAVEIQSGGTPQSSQNIIVPIGEVYTNAEVLDKVSKLTVLEYVGTGDGDQIVYCQAFEATNGKGKHSPTFSNGKEGPAHLSTNTVVVGSLVCNLGQETE